MTLPLIGIFVSLAVLLVLAYRGHSVVAVAPIAALVAAAFSQAPLLATYTQIFMPALGKFIVNFFPLFIAGAIFGKLMSSSGLAADVAQGISRVMGPKRAILSTALASAVLTYGGVSAWVVAFTIVPIASALFRQAGIPKRLMPAAIAFGAVTFALSALPGSPQVHNVIPTKYFGTTTYAAPVLGLTATAMMFALGLVWLRFRARTLMAAGEGYLPPGEKDVEHSPEEVPFVDPQVEPEPHVEPGHVVTDLADPESHTHHEHVVGAHAGPWRLAAFLGTLPVVVVIGMNYLFLKVLAPRLNFDYLAEDKFGATTLASVQGVWSVVVAIVTAILVIFALRPKLIKEMLADLSEGAKNAVLPCFTTASEVGYGAVVASLAVFAAMKTQIFASGGDALVVGAATTALISGITGSASGGMSITLEAFADQLQTMAVAQGISVDTLHRVIALSSTCFDSLPHNGAILTLLLVCNMTHKQSYKDVAVITVIIPASVLVVLMAGMYLVH